MIARASQLFLPTLRDAPADAEAVNHKLLVRGAFARQVTGGVWTFLPLGWRVHRKIEQIIREEMDAIGCQEMLMPVLTPFELWQQTGRDFIQEIFRLKDRKGADYVLPMTHEETVTFHARELQSYRQLPQMLYHISIKERDEPRPRAGLIRLREFIMKDAYSFDRDEAGLAQNFELQRGAYKRIFERCGLKVYDVEAESGMMGGSESVDFLAPAGAGENTLVTCENGDFAADIEVARGVPRAPTFPDDARCARRGRDAGRQDVRGTRRLSLDRCRGDLEGDAGDRRRRDSRARADPRRRSDRACEARRGARPPVAAGDRRGDPRGVRRERRLARPGRLQGRGRRRRDACATASSSRARTATAGTCEESRRAATSRPASPTCASPPTATPVRTAAGRLLYETAIEVGHIFKLGTRYSEPLGANFLDEEGQERPVIMGSYGIGLARVLAALVEQRHDEHGISWPASVAPYDVHVVVLTGAEEIGLQAAEVLSAAGKDVLLDDRDRRPGEKFADADLIGIPIRVTAGKKSLDDGAVDVRDRSTGAERRVNVADLGTMS